MMKTKIMMMITEMIIMKKVGMMMMMMMMMVMMMTMMIKVTMIMKKLRARSTGFMSAGTSTRPRNSTMKRLSNDEDVGRASQHADKRFCRAEIDAAPLHHHRCRWHHAADTDFRGGNMAEVMNGCLSGA
ncbi:unnamed protein product [Heligmosomoides polygyrus]|uniref:Secreted protein n=1 Tax=Heligmosomoides polygyrus TaxID=6339 RepID=A0A183FGZ7_HELPZ|nr:unnamed protein product [Heligmosomoides polygyrus]